MKKTLLFISLLFVSAVGFAQQNYNEAAPVVQSVATPPYLEDRALWTVQMDVDPLSVFTRLAGICWTGTEFWVTKWNSDSIWTLNASGAITAGPFVVSGITAARSVTTDGTNLFLAANTTQIFKVNPVTKTLISTITTSVANCRFLTYDPTLDSGAGGFWTGTFASDITAVNMTGGTVSTIPAGTHGLSGMYGAAYDSYSLGGPYLWINDQGPAGTSANIVQLNIASGMPTGLMHDTQTDLAGGANTGIAGGLYITNSLVAGQKTIGGINQGVSIFAYELNEPSGVEYISPNEFNLTVYPNPSSASSEVSFKLKTENTVQLEVINLLGSSVYKSISEKMTAGKHAFAIDEKNMDNGIYFVKLTVGTKTVSSKITVTK